MRRACKNVTRASPACVQKRHQLTPQDHLMRRPEGSSAMFRSVQDYKPKCHEVAHSRGSEIEEATGKTCIMHMILIDSMGFRWPIRFRKTPRMRLIDLFRETDDDWFGVQPGTRQTSRGDMINSVLRRARHDSVCYHGSPDFLRCSDCAVTVPYEYLDAMEPPNKWEMDWLFVKTNRGIIHPTSNTRMACQVYIEDWMDGMTVVLPQTDSMVYQLYYQHGVDRDTMDFAVANVAGVRNNDPNSGYAFVPASEKNPNKKNPAEQHRDGELNMDDYGTGIQETGWTQTVPLSKIFWTDNIDDVIRAKYPDWKGRYEFLNK